MTARLTLIAHAATQAQRHAAFPLDEPVTEREIARIAALNWSPPRSQLAASAPEQRTQQTSRALGLRAAISEDLRECDYGTWRGRSMDEVQSENPEGILAWLTDPGASPHGGESIANLIERIGRWMEEQRDIAHLVAVTHPAVIRAAIVHALRMSAQSFWRFDIAPLSVTDLRFSRNIWSVRCIGCALRAGEQAEEHDASG